MINDDTRQQRIAEREQHQKVEEVPATPQGNASPPPPLSQWRTDVLTLTARILFVLGLFMLIPSMIIAFSLQEFWRLLVDVPILVLMGAIAFVPRLGFALRTTLLLGLLSSASVLWLTLSGLVGSGRLYLVLLMVLAALLLNLRGALLVWLLSLLSIGTIYWGFATVMLPLPLEIVERMFTPATLTTHWLAQVAVSGVIVAAIVLTINRLQHSFRTAEEARVQLQRLNEQLEQRVAERTAALMQANEHLQAEIREREQAEEALRASEERFTTFMTYLPGPAFIHDENGRVVFANRTYCQHLNSPPEQVIGQPFSELMSPKLAAYFQAQDQQVLTTQEAGVFEDHAEIDGQLHVFLATKFPVQQADGSIHIGGVALDITARKEAEEALRESERFVQQMTATIPGILYVYDLILERNVYSNRQMTDILGYTSEEVQAMGQDVMPTLLHPDDLSRAAEHRMMQAQAAEESVLAFEYRMRNRDGTWRWLLSREVVFTRTADRQPQQILGIAQDITERKQAEEAYHNLVQFSLQGLMILQAGRVVFANPAIELIHGYTMAELQAMSPEDLLSLVHPDDRATVQERMQSYMINGIDAYRHEHRIVDKQGQTRWVEVYVAQVDFRGTVAFQLTFLDISERKQAEEALRQSEQRLKAIFDNAAVGIGLTDNAGRSIIANARGAHQLGYTPEELAQRSNLELTHPDDRADTVERMQRLVRGQIQGYRIEKRYFRKDGSIFWADLSVSAVYDDDGQIAYLLGIVVDISERKQLEHQLHQANMLLQEQAIRDPLTGLYNRRYLDETLPRELQRAERAGQSVGVIMLDIDHFKRINDTYGHNVGDMLLRAVGAFLRHNTRGADIVCRYGGEEFTLVLPGASSENACHRAEELRAGIQALAVKHNGQALETVTASLGIAIFRTHGTTAEALVSAADEALYQAKHSGRNRVVMADGTHD